MNIDANTTGTADEHEIDHEGHHPARQYALEQLRVHDRIVGVRLDFDRHSNAPSGSDLFRRPRLRHEMAKA